MSPTTKHNPRLSFPSREALLNHDNTKVAKVAAQHFLTSTANRKANPTTHTTLPSFMSCSNTSTSDRDDYIKAIGVGLPWFANFTAKHVTKSSTCICQNGIVSFYRIFQQERIQCFPFYFRGSSHVLSNQIYESGVSVAARLLGSKSLVNPYMLLMNFCSTVRNCQLVERESST